MTNLEQQDLINEIKQEEARKVVLQKTTLNIKGEDKSFQQVGLYMGASAGIVLVAWGLKTLFGGKTNE